MILGRGGRRGGRGGKKKLLHEMMYDGAVVDLGIRVLDGSGVCLFSLAFISWVWGFLLFHLSGLIQWVGSGREGGTRHVPMPWPVSNASLEDEG